MTCHFAMLVFLVGVLLLPSCNGVIEIDRIMREAKDEYETDLMTKTLAGAKSIHHRRKFTKESRGMVAREELIRRAVNRLTSEGVEKPEALAVVRNFMEDRMLECGRVGGYGDHSEVVMAASDLCSTTNPQCSATKYRRIDGKCNNLEHPRWGSMSIAMRRFAPPKYADETGKPRDEGGDDGDPSVPIWEGEGEVPYYARPPPSETSSGLPNARLVSTTVHGDSFSSDRTVTHIFTQMGQFIDHDITLTPEKEVDHCCRDTENAACFPIKVPSTDGFFKYKGVTCLDFARSEPFCPSQNKVREQINAITAWVDASNVYGSDDATAKSLRTLSGGLLKATIKGGKEFLPLLRHSEGEEFTAGDVRAIEMPGLATMHTLFLREHNRIARAMSKLKPTLDDETLYQEARRIVGAEMQNVVFGQYLDALLGPTRPGTTSRGYNPSADPSIRNEFATAAFRFGHSMIEGMIDMMINPPWTSRTYWLRDHYFNLENYFRDDGAGMEQILAGLINQASQSFDKFMSEELTRFLFPAPGASFGSDLAARNIQRGRDHGLNGYNTYRKICRLPAIYSWDQRPEEITSGDWSTLKSLYATPDDIDLFTVGLVEKPISGSIVGPLFNCLISKQFHLLKDSDRYFFTHTGQSGSFNSNQIEVLQKRTLRDIICDNTDISIARPNVFLLSSVPESCTKSYKLPIDVFLH